MAKKVKNINYVKQLLPIFNPCQMQKTLITIIIDMCLPHQFLSGRDEKFCFENSGINRLLSFKKLHSVDIDPSIL